MTHETHFGVSPFVRRWWRSTDTTGLKSALFERRGPGYAVLDCSGLLEAVRSDSRVLRELSTALQEIAEPIVVFLRQGLWKKVPVNHDVPPHRVTGTGLIPLHIDCVNTLCPPDLVAFFCETDDDDGGASLITNFTALKQELSSEDLIQLANIRIVEGKFYDLDNVGGEFNPFPLVQFSGDKILWVRHTGKVLREAGPLSAQAFKWIKRIDDVLTDRAHHVPLSAGQMLIVNQHLCAHGRLPLRLVTAPDRASDRTLWQCFFRAPDAYLTKCLLKPADISSSRAD